MISPSEIEEVRIKVQGIPEAELEPRRNIFYEDLKRTWDLQPTIYGCFALSKDFFKFVFSH